MQCCAGIATIYMVGIPRERILRVPAESDLCVVSDASHHPDSEQVYAYSSIVHVL